MTLSEFAKFGVMDHRSQFLQLGLYGPVLITGASLAFKAFKNPEIVKKQILNAKQLVVKSFSRQEKESDGDFQKRLIKNVLKVVAALSILAAAGALPFILLPASFALPAALIAIGSSALVLKNGGKWKNQIVAAYTPQAGETAQEAKRRILKNILIGLAVAGLLVAFGVLGSSWISMLMSGGIWGFTSVIPQTPITLFLEYGALGLLHFALAIKKAMHGDKAEALYHLANGVLSFVFPAFYVFYSGGELRLHHSFLGLLMQLAPFPGLRFFGAMVALDSSLYMFSDARGFFKGQIFESADFMNIVVDHLSAFVLVLTATSVIYQLVKEFLFSKDVDLRCGNSSTEMTSLSDKGTSSKRLPSSSLS